MSAHCAMVDPDKKPKRRPGRPSHKPKPPPVPATGVADAPRNPDAIVEVVLDAPQELKRMFKLFASLNVADIFVEFAPERAVFYSKANKVTVVAQISGAQTNHYFCAAPGLKCSITRAKFDAIFAVPGADVHVTELCVLRSPYNYKSLDITYVNTVLEKRSQYTIVLSNFDDGNAALVREMEQAVATVADEDVVVARYPLEWRLEAAQFKQMINTNKKATKVLTVEKLVGRPLTLKYLLANHHDYTETYENDEKISLRVADVPGGLFNADLSTANVAPLASSGALPVVRILCSNDAPTLYRSVATTKKDGPESSAAFSLNVLVEQPESSDY